MKQNHLKLIFILGGFLFVVDRILKYFAYNYQELTYFIWKPWLGWEYFGNTGIAFSLPVPNWLVIIFTPVILLGLIAWLFLSLRGAPQGATKQSQGPLGLVGVRLLRRSSFAPRNDIFVLSLCLIILGALSNYFDRLFYGLTIDYIRIFTGVINLADLMIIVGVVLIILWDFKKKAV